MPVALPIQGDDDDDEEEEEETEEEEDLSSVVSLLMTNSWNLMSKSHQKTLPLTV